MRSFARALWRQAQHDFDHAQPARAMGDVDWAALAAQPAGAKALKAVLVCAGRRAALRAQTIAGRRASSGSAPVHAATRKARAAGFAKSSTGKGGVRAGQRALGQVRLGEAADRILKGALFLGKLEIHDRATPGPS